ncbi:MAG: FAD-dependent monooxygenase, partial [Proteobacteria bacterium]|nr:FAD-dependent monooxygenase [Pseudomonadota bacterium]
MTAETLDFDLIIVGAGPVGLCFARALSGTRLRIALVERLPEAALAAPAYDGREIALTQRSARLLRQLGVWERLPAAELAPLRSARVLNGVAPEGLDVQPPAGTHTELGYLISNHLIRRAAFDAVVGQEGLSLLAGTAVVGVATDGTGGRV